MKDVHLWPPFSNPGQLAGITRKVDVRLPGKGNSNSHGARPVHLIITMLKWIRTSRLSTQNSLWRAEGRPGVLMSQVLQCTLFCALSVCLSVCLSVSMQLFRGGLVFNAHRLLYQSTLGLRVINKKKGRPGVLISQVLQCTQFCALITCFRV